MQIDPNNYYDVLTNYEISTAEEEISENDAANYLLHEFVKRSPAKLLEQYIADKRNGYQKEGFDRLFNSENIKRWMSGRPISCDKAFELSIYFGLDMAESEIFVRKYCMCDWLYLRDYSDSVYCFFIKNAAALGLDGGQAVEKVREVIKTFDDVYEEHIRVSGGLDEGEMSKNRFKRLRFESKLNPCVDDSEPITKRCKQKLDMCTSIEELSDFFNENIDCFGEFNRKAYETFMHELELNRELYYKKNGTKKTISEIVDQICIDFDIEEDDRRPIRTTNAYKDLLKDLRTNNPDRQGLEATISRKKPVTRKQLIMLFLLNECESDHDADDFECAEDEIEERRMRINMMLYDCGMPLLDSYQPFDWLILNALATIPEHRNYYEAKSLLSSNFFELLLSKIAKGNNK